MSWRLPDGVLDDTHEWQNENDMREYDRAFLSSAEEDQKIAVALMCADPATPDRFIRRNLMADPGMPPRYGYTDNEPTIDDVLVIGSARTNGTGTPQMGAH